MENVSDTFNPRMSTTAQVRESVGRALARPVARLESANPQAQMHLPLRSVRRDLQYLLQTLRTSAPLWVADQLALAVSLVLTTWIGVAINPSLDIALIDLAIPLLPALTLASITLRLYPGIGLSTASELRLTTIAATLVFGVFLIATSLMEMRQFDTLIALTGSYVGCLVLLPVFRSLARILASGCVWWKQPALIFGGTEEGARAYRTLLEHPQLGLRPIGLLDDLHHHWRDTQSEPQWYLGQFSDAPIVADKGGVFWGIVAMSDRNADEVAALLDHISTSIPNLLILPAFAQAGREWDGAHHYGNSLGARCTEMLLLPIPRFVKKDNGPDCRYHYSVALAAVDVGDRDRN